MNVIEQENDRLDSYIEVPFEHRHLCWFCGEPANKHFSFPHANYIVLEPCHPVITVPSCSECRQFAGKAEVDTLWQVKHIVKKSLIHQYRKHLAIGLNWTKEELANSQFEGGNFEGFQKSAWFMYEVAKQRVNFSAWPVVLNGLIIEEITVKERFLFDGVDYPSIDEAIAYYTRHYDLPKNYLQQVVASLGSEQFSKAVRHCRLLVGSTPAERKQALRELVLEYFNQGKEQHS